MTISKEEAGRLILEASTDMHGYEARRLVDAWADMAAKTEAQAQEIEALRAQVQEEALCTLAALGQAEEAHADAQRYRWLRRDSRPCDLVQFVDVSNGCGAFGARTEDELDQAIDAAMKVNHDRP